MTQPFKICPQCQEPAHMGAAMCARCGRVYQTTAPPPMNQTQIVHPPQYPQQAPPPYNPYGPYLPQRRLPGIMVTPGTHSAGTALLLSLLCFVCAGQFYNKQVTKGFALLVGAIIAAVFTGGLSILITYPMAIIDAYLIGHRLNRGEVVGEWQWF